jgi:putative sugar O-methyltransferase
MSRFAHILQFVQSEIARRDAAPAGVLTPSDYWKDYNRFSSYVRTLPDEELRYIRRHTWHLTGDRYDHYHFASDKLRRRIIAQYESTLPRLGGFQPQEPPDGIGVDSPYGQLNSGILRYTVVLGDLIEAGLLAREGAPRVLEIGGGYGGLALLCLQFNPRIAYVICDLEESLFIQGVFLTRHLGAERVKLGLAQGLEPGQVALVPQSRAEMLAGERFDFAVNQQSMQEMTLAQVEHYADLLGKCAERFYSCNRRSHGAGIVRDKGLVADLHQALARRFDLLWDSTESLPPLARLCMRHKLARKLVTAFIGKSFLPVGEASLRRFVYRCR